MSDQPSKPVEYRPVEGYPGYRVGDDGTVWSQRVTGTSGRISDTWKKLKPSLDDDGYLVVGLAINKKTITRKVHHLVLLSFGFERPSSKHVTRHINDVKSDNRLENIVWGTVADNNKDKVIHGKSRPGEEHHAAKFTDEDIHKIRFVYIGISNVKVGAMFGVSDVTISCIRRRKTWKHLP